MKVTAQVECYRVRGAQEIPAGKPFRFGSHGDCGCPLPPDASFPGTSFSLYFDGERCLLQDDGHGGAIYLNGMKAGKAELEDEDLIQAGRCIVRVRFVPGEEESPNNAAVLDILNGPAQPLYALLDAARDPQVLEILRRSGEPVECLYEGEKAEELGEWAPYLAPLPAASPLLRALAARGWGKSWGLYVSCAQPAEEVKKHFRHFLMVEQEGGETVYFRFYDPRVLRTFLPTCNGGETRQFFGPVQAFWMEDEDPSRMLRFTTDGGSVHREVRELKRRSAGVQDQKATV